MPSSRFALHGLARPYFTVCAPFLPLIHGLCAFFRPLVTPVSAAPSLLASQFTVCTSRFTQLPNFLFVGFFFCPLLCEGEGGGCTWVKPGRFGSFFVLCFPALGGHCRQMLCLPGFGTHANTQNLPHFRAFPASIWENSLPKCLFLKANAKLPNRPGFALLQGGDPALFCSSYSVLV